MSREDFDIPEAFRRAMEEGGWNFGGGNEDEDDGGGNGGDGGDGGGRRPFPRRPGRPFWRNRTFWVLAALFLLFISFNWIVSTFTELMWFRQIQYEDVWFKRWILQVIGFGVGFVLAMVMLLGNWLVAKQRATKTASPFSPNVLTQIPGISWLLGGIAIFFSFGFASTTAAQWEEFLRFVYSVDYGLTDPIFNREVSFYLFSLPIYDFVQGWFISLLFIALIGVVGLYAFNYLPELQRGRWQPQNITALRQHAAILGTIILVLWAIGYWFDIYNLMYSPRGVAFGASYTDINASLWALRAQIVFVLLTAVALIYNIFKLDLRPVIVTGGLWIAATFILGGLLPGIQQRYVVEPNELERERPYITHNIEFTREAFALNEIETRDFGNVTDLTEQDLIENQATINNVRLWDYRPLRDTYEQLQALRTYYQFGELDIDRYEIDGEIRQVMLGARELNKDNLPSPSWVNRNLEFTHGYGLVMNPVNRVTADGRPEFFIQDLPPQTKIDLEVTRPEIYYGELDDDVVYVSSGREEFDYPSGDENVYSSYSGTGGVPLDSFLKRLAFAIRFADINVLLSDDINSGTRVQLHRTIRDRIQQITPFLALDDDPYIVVTDDGRLMWIADAYTLSSRFPYSTPIGDGRFNYIRNAVKITVDAYNGTVNYYIADPDDPIIQTYNAAFPGLFQDMDAMPADLMSHIRYPEDLFLVQMQQFITYHMQDVRVFYNKEDKWSFPTELFEGSEQAMEPYYVTTILPGEEDAEQEYLLILPFTPASKQNMVAWAAARNDPEHYGQLVVYELPKQELIFGPMQIEGRIDQEPSISEQFSLWNQQGSRVIRGNLLVIPMNSSFLYVEPIYLRADTSALPELKRVIVASDTRLGMLTTLEGALQNLLGGIPLETLDGVQPGDDAPIITGDSTVDELIVSANAHLEAAEQAQRDGDWATYGEELDALKSDLAQLEALIGADAPESTPEP